MRVARFAVAVLVSTAVGLAVVPAQADPSGEPIKIGSTLALTGPLAATAIIHKIVGEIYVDNLNHKNGLLGRPSNGTSRTTSRSPIWRAPFTNS